MLNLFLGPIHVSMGLWRKAGYKYVISQHFLVYIYTVATMVNLMMISYPPPIVLRYMDGGPWITTPLILLTTYAARTLTQLGNSSHFSG